MDHYGISVRKELSRYRGREVKSSAHKYLATFDGPARAIRHACSMATLARQLQIDVKIGLHTGECDIVGIIFPGHSGYRLKDYQRGGLLRGSGFQHG